MDKKKYTPAPKAIETRAVKLNEGSAKARRSAARLAAVQVLYQSDLNDQNPTEAMRDFLQHRNGFEFDGDMQPDVALDEKYKELYPFSKIVGNANVLIMPAQHSAAISLKLMKTLGGAKIIGPFLVGLGQPIEIAPLRSSTSDILNLASIAAYSSEVIDYNKKN